MKAPTDRTGLDEPSDAEIRALGLQPTRAWVRAQATGKARRNRKHRERAAAQGRRQLSVAVPDEARETVRGICRQLCAGELQDSDLRAFAGQSPRSLMSARRIGEPSTFGGIPVPRQVLVLAGSGAMGFLAGVLVALGLE